MDEAYHKKTEEYKTKAEDITVKKESKKVNAEGIKTVEDLKTRGLLFVWTLFINLFCMGGSIRSSRIQPKWLQPHYNKVAIPSEF